MINNLHKFWIQHKESIKEHWPMTVIHIIFAVYLIAFLMEKYQ